VTLRAVVRVRVQLVDAGTAQASTRTFRTSRGARWPAWTDEVAALSPRPVPFPGAQPGEFVIEGTACRLGFPVELASDVSETGWGAFEDVVSRLRSESLAAWIEFA
jgi:hypothetical protein